MPDFIAIIPDFPGVLDKRMAVRGLHMEGIPGNVQNGNLTLAGGTLASLPKAGETPNLNGSVLSVVADNEEEVKKFLKTDIYFKEGVWDVENAKIFPYLCAARVAK